MEEEEALAKKDAAEAACNAEEVRLKRLAYFQNLQAERGLATTGMDTKNTAKHGVNKTIKRMAGNETSLLKCEKARTSKTSEFHVKVKSEREESSKGTSDQSEQYISYTSSKSAPSKRLTGNADSSRERRRGSTSSLSDDDVGPLVRPPCTRPAVSMKPSVSSNVPQFSANHSASINRGRWVSNEDVRQPDGEKLHRVVRNSGDSEVENLFSNRKWVSANEIPALSLKESVDADSVSVFKSKADFDNLGLSTHRPESTTRSSVADFTDGRKGTRQRSMSSESLLLGSKAEEMRSLLGEQRYKEFVEKSERELSQLHRIVEATHSSLQWSGEGGQERATRRDGPAQRNTPPPQPPSPQPGGASSNRGPSPRRRLRSSSPQMVTRTLQDIARTKEIRESATSRNYEQVVVPHNVTFSADEIYRQAYGGGVSGGNEVRKSSSSSVGSGYPDPGTSYWNTITPRQMAGSMSPSSPHAAPMFQAPFMQMSAGGPMHPPMTSQHPVYAASPNSTGAYFYPQGQGVAVNMAGGGQFYARQQNMFMAVPSGTPPQSPDSYFYHVHPLSQSPHSMPGFHAPSGPMQNPAEMSWQYGQHGQPAPGQLVQGPGQHLQGPAPHVQQGQQGHHWHHFGQGGEQNSSQYYNQNWQENPGLLQTPHPPNKATSKGDSSRSEGISATEHADAVRQHHEQRRQAQEKQAHVNSNQAQSNFSLSSIERYFASLGMPPPNYPPPPYHVHPPPPSPHPPQQRQQGGSRPPVDVHRSSDSQLDDDDMTTVTRTSLVTGTSIAAGGITERMEQLGVDPVVLQSLKQRPDIVAADEEALDAMRNLVRICPECQAVNKEYMTWCLQCGGVLIGVDPISTKDLKKKNKEKRGGAGSSSKPRKSQSKPEKAEAPDPAAGQSPDSQEPFLEYEERIEEIIYDHSEGGRESPEVEQSPQVVSPLRDSDVEEQVEKEVDGTKESPESGRGASAASSPARRNISWEMSEDARDLSQNTVEVTENKDSGRPSSGEGAESRKPPLSSQFIPEDGPQRSEKEINDICEVISDPIIRGFIKNYLQKKPQEQVPDFGQASSSKHSSSQHGGSAPGRQGGSAPGKQIGSASGKQSGIVSGKQGGSASGKQSGSHPVSQSQTPSSKPVSLDLGASVSSLVSKSDLTKAPSSAKKVESSKKKRSRKGSKKGHEAIDVEIFAIEEAKLCRSARAGANLVPMLNLAHSSDEEEDSSERTSSLQGVPSVGYGASSDASSPRDDTAPINYSNEVKAMAVKTQASEETSNNLSQSQSHEVEQAPPNPEISNSNFQFLQQLVEGRESAPPAQRKKTTGQSRPQPQRKPSPTSKVRASIEAPAASRHWMRSSIAWSSYNPRELRTRSSLNFQQGSTSGPSRQPPGNVRACRSTDNLVDSNPPEMAPSQRPRPASADQHNRRGANRGRPTSATRGGRPYSAGHYISGPVPRQQVEAAMSAGTGDHAASSQPMHSAENDSDVVASAPCNNTAPCDNTDIEGRPIHRLAMQDNTLPMIPMGPSAARKIYDRCTEVTPRNEQNSKWLFLPDELWLHVFTFLSQLDLFHVTLTCKQLYRISLDPQLWKSVTIRKKAIRNDWLIEIAKRHPVSLAMVQCHGDKLSENTLRELFKEIAPKLKELNFSRCSKGKLIGDEILLHASTHCRHLTHVDASWCHVTDVGLTALAGCCHRLESLCLNGCQQITDESLKAVVEKHGTSLRMLELFGCFSLTPASFRYLAEHCTFLLTLNMGQCYKISDSNMMTLSASLSHVETLDLRGCKKLGDMSIRKIVRNCRRLRHLTLANCPLISDAAIVEIATYSTDIRSLDVCGCSNISDSSIRTLASNCYRLTSIDISSTSCTHKSVLIMAEFSRNLECAKFNFLADVHEKSLAKLIKNCKRLNTVHLYGCNVRDTAGLKRYNRFLKIEM